MAEHDRTQKPYNYGDLADVQWAELPQTVMLLKSERKMLRGMELKGCPAVRRVSH